jgi:hypothetical protein
VLRLIPPAATGVGGEKGAAIIYHSVPRPDGINRASALFSTSTEHRLTPGQHDRRVSRSVGGWDFVVCSPEQYIVKTRKSP